MTDEGRSPAVILIAMVAIASVVGYLYLNGSFSTYSAGATSCTKMSDVISGQAFENCSSLQVLPSLSPQSVVAQTSSGDSITLYDTNSSSPTFGRSTPLTKDARITLSIGNANPIGISGTFTCAALVDGKIITTATNTTTFPSTPKETKVCGISIDGKTLQTEYYNPSVSTHVVSMTLSGKTTYVFPTGKAESRSFSGSLGNITITISAPTNTTQSDSDITVNNDRVLIGDGSGSVIYSSSSTVTGPTAPLAELEDYTEQATQVIQQSEDYTSPQEVSIDGNTLDVPAGVVGSASYSPTADGQGTVTVTVTESDKVIYERDATNTAKMFGGYDQMTSYSKCTYFLQC